MIFSIPGTITGIATTTPTVVANTGSYDTFLDVATLNGNITDDGGTAITEKGFYYAVDDATITNADTKVTNIAVGTGTYSDTVNVSQTGSAQTLYYRAFATNINGEVLSSTTESIVIPAI